MPCADRQLTDAEREAAFEQQRTGVQRGIRPFTGEATPEAIAEYLNREVFPVLKQARDKINEVYLPVVDNAPSANPLGFYFSETTTNADPTTGYIQLDNATQNIATTIRVSQQNGRDKDITTWLAVMSGSATSPLGVVTLSHAINPSRFLRFDLTSMTDQGAYWDLAVTAVESSHTNPFVEDDQIAIQFIPGVSSGTTVVAPGAAPAWDDVLTAGNNTGANNPHIDTSQYIGFGTEGSLPASGQLRSSSDLEVNATTDIHLHPGQHLHLGHTGSCNEWYGESDTLMSLTTAGPLSMSAGTNWSAVAGGTSAIQSGSAMTLTDTVGPITASAATKLTLGGTNEVEVNSTLVDINGSSVTIDSSSTVVNITTATVMNLNAGSNLVANANGGSFQASGSVHCIFDATNSVFFTAGVQVDFTAPNAEFNLTGDMLVGAASGINLRSGSATLLGADTGDIALNATGGVAVRAGTATTGTATGATDGNLDVRVSADVLVNAASGVSIYAGATPVTTVSGVAIQADGAGLDIVMTATDAISATATGGSLSLTAGADLLANATSGVFVGAAVSGSSVATGNIEHAGTADSLWNMQSGMNITLGGTALSGPGTAVGTGVLAVNADTGISLRAGHATANNTGTGDILANATSGIHLFAGATPQTAASGIQLTSDTVVDAQPTTDLRVGAGSGFNLRAGSTTLVSADDGDGVLQATGGIAIRAGTGTLGTVTGAADGTVSITASDDVTINPTDDLVLQTNSNTWVRVNAAGDADFENGLDFDVTGNATLDSSGTATLTSSTGMTVQGASLQLQANTNDVSILSVFGAIGINTNAGDISLEAGAAAGGNHNIHLRAAGGAVIIYGDETGSDDDAVLQIAEHSSSPTGVSGYSQVWVDNLAPTKLMHTDDVDADWAINVSGMANLSAITTRTNSTTALSGAQVDIPANTWRAGTSYRFSGMLHYSRGSTATASNLQIDIRVAGTAQAGTVALATSTTNGYNGMAWVEGYVTCITTGASGTAIATARVLHTIPSTTLALQASSHITTFTLNTTASTSLDLTAFFSAAVANLSMTWQQANIVRVS